MKRHYLLACMLGMAATVASAQSFEDREVNFPTTFITESGDIYVQDSVYTFNSSDAVKNYELHVFNSNGYKSETNTFQISWDGKVSQNGKTGFSYNGENQLIETRQYSWKDGAWVDLQHENYYYTGNRLDSMYISAFDWEIGEWYSMRREYSFYNDENILNCYEMYAQNGVYEEMNKDFRIAYSEYNQFGKPAKGKSYNNGGNGEWRDYMNVYLEYDEHGFLTKVTYKKILEDGSDENSSATEWVYSDDGVLLAEIVYYSNYQTKDLEPSSKSEYLYDETIGCLKEMKSYRYVKSSATWNYSGKTVYYWSKFEGTDTEAVPLARIGSHWNYWVAQEYSFGYTKYKVVKDTVITAPVFETGQILTAKTSWIEKYNNLTFHGAESGDENRYQGCFGAIRMGNASYVYEPRIKKWFKWVDMDAELGDRWVVPEIITGKGVYDYVEVSFKDSVEVDGRKVPYIYLMPSCTSRFETQKDFTSRIAMNGYFNIDYWSLYGAPEAGPNGVVYTGELREVNVGLLCADVNGESLVTEQLEEYVKSNNKPYYDQGIIECDSLHAPIPQQQAGAPVKPVLERNKLAYDIHTTPMDRVVRDSYWSNQAEEGWQMDETVSASTDLITIPVVVHVVHNPATPEEKITEEQIGRMIEELNLAYSTTNEDLVREPFKNVVGNPHVNFVLADKDPFGASTTGVLYYETAEDYYSLPNSQDVKVRYAYKFNEDGTARNWDNKRYVNFYVVDLGGFDQKSNVGGFVTNPEPQSTEDWELQKLWYKNGNPTFWQNWIDSEEGSWLDGLTVDTWYTFGGASEKNPMATYKTAIHELGHYLGLRHVAVQVVQNADDSIELFDDGFTDTPFTHYNQYALVSCDQDIFQCGELVQVENYMDYCLECACMFTKQQAAFIRNFVNVARHAFMTPVTGLDEVSAEAAVAVYPNPATEVLCFSGDFVGVRVCNEVGQVVLSVSEYTPQVSVEHLPAGVYFVQFMLEDGTVRTEKVVIL